MGESTESLKGEARLGRVSGEPGHVCVSSVSLCTWLGWPTQGRGLVFKARGTNLGFREPAGGHLGASTVVAG